jgi:hypothetical protein
MRDCVRVEKVDIFSGDGFVRVAMQQTTLWRTSFYLVIASNVRTLLAVSAVTAQGRTLGRRHAAPVQPRAV